MKSPFRYSTISDFHRCGKYYELKHLLGHDDGSDKSADLKFGTVVHLAIQDLFEGGDGVTVFDLYWNTYEKAPLEYSRYGWAELRPLGLALVEIFRDEHMSKFAPQHLERKMHGQIGGHLFSGTADFIGTYKGVLSLVDWKTAAYPYDSYKLKVNEQIYGYVELARQDLGLDIQQGVYGVAVKDPKNPRWQFKTASITPEKLTKKVGNIEAACSTIANTKQFLMNPGQCVVGKRVCAFFEHCHGGAKDGGQEGEGT